MSPSLCSLEKNASSTLLPDISSVNLSMLWPHRRVSLLYFPVAMPSQSFVLEKNENYDQISRRFKNMRKNTCMLAHLSADIICVQNIVFLGIVKRYTFGSL